MSWTTLSPRNIRRAALGPGDFGPRSDDREWQETPEAEVRHEEEDADPVAALRAALPAGVDPLVAVAWDGPDGAQGDCEGPLSAVCVPDGATVVWMETHSRAGVTYERHRDLPWRATTPAPWHWSGWQTANLGNAAAAVAEVLENCGGWPADDTTTDAADAA